MSAVYKSICNEADTFLLLVTKLAEKEIQLKLDLENLMNKGFINIAKARYIMGSTCVTKMQLPTQNSNPIQPLATVFKKEVNNSWVFYISRRTCSKNSESTSDVFKDDIENSENDYISAGSSATTIDNIDKSEAEFKNILYSDPKSLKKSKNAFLVEDDLYQSYNDELLDEVSNVGSKESLVSVADPMRLFGILVPKAMKQAQVIFIEVVNLLGECATIQSELRKALNKYYHLEKIKRLIEAASKEVKLDILTPKVYWTPTESSSLSCFSEESRKSEESSVVNVTKSVRSVFYDTESINYEEDNAEQQAEFSIWNSVINESESNN